jgi:hypothetical protein
MTSDRACPPVPEVVFPQCSLGFSRGALLNDSDRELALCVRGGECRERVGRLCQLVGVPDVHTQCSVGEPAGEALEVFGGGRRHDERAAGAFAGGSGG